MQKVVDEICHAYKEDMLYNGSFKDEGIKYDVLFVTSDRGEELRDVTLQITANINNRKEKIIEEENSSFGD